MRDGYYDRYACRKCPLKLALFGFELARHGCDSEFVLPGPESAVFCSGGNGSAEGCAD